MMREGTKTVLSMRNNYEGPPEGFAMVIPVPQVLQEENVKTLNDELFERVDQLAAPRLVEYWEQDPCGMDYGMLGRSAGGLGMMGTGRGGGGFGGRVDQVKVEAQFDVGEYNVVVLSATESNALEGWLKQENYNIPAGAAPLLKPYVEQGMYFFAARVDPSKVTFKDGQAMLSPLRFHYDSKDFSLPVRLGLINAKGAQDLLVHILARGQRYEVANYPNVTIPTNLIVKSSIRERFAHFYTTLFDRVLEENPGAVVTEYAWNASSCDPCPTPALRADELQTLGGDVLDAVPQAGGRGGLWGSGGWVLTRMHARYTAETMKQDLVFTQAEPLVGGRGMPYGMQVIKDGVIGEQRGVPGPMNNFQGRYIMLNEWEGELKCESPRRGQWGGPVDGGQQETLAATDTAFVPRDTFKLPEVMVTQDIPQLKSLDASPIAQVGEVIEEPSKGSAVLTQGSSQDGKGGALPAPEADKPASGCATAAPSDMPGAGLGFALLGLLGLLRRRRDEARSAPHMM